MTEIILETFREKFIWPLSQNLDIWRHFGPQNDPFWQFSPKMTYFDQIYAINGIFDYIFIHKPDWNNF